MGVVVAQGATFVGAGAAAQVVPPASVIAIGGGIGALIAVGLTISWRRVTASPRLPGTGLATWAQGGPPAAETLVSSGADEYLEQITSVSA